MEKDCLSGATWNKPMKIRETNCLVKTQDCAKLKNEVYSLRPVQCLLENG